MDFSRTNPETGRVFRKRLWHETEVSRSTRLSYFNARPKMARWLSLAPCPTVLFAEDGPEGIYEFNDEKNSKERKHAIDRIEALRKQGAGKTAEITEKGQPCR